MAVRRSLRPRRESQARAAERSDSDSDGGRPVRRGRKTDPEANPWLGMSDEDRNAHVKKLVRVIVAAHYNKVPIRRADLTRALVGPGGGRVHNKLFNGALGKALIYLKKTLGWQLVEVQRRTRSSLPQRRTQTQALSQTQGAGPKGERAYIVINNLEEELRPKPKEMAIYGFIMAIAAMILLEPGARLLQKTLYTNLGRLGLKMTGKKEDNHPQLGNLCELLEKKLTSQWYFEREREGPDAYFYLLGPRLLHELEDDHLLAFISAVYQTPLDEASRKELKLRLVAMRATSDQEESD